MKLYDSGDLVGQFADGITPVLLWVGAGVGGGVILFFAFLGIRSGFRFLNNVINYGWSRGRSGSVNPKSF